MMNKRTLVCIVCPNCCWIEIEFAAEDIRSICGAQCKKGEEFAVEEVQNPRRVFTGSVAVRGGTFPLTSVKSSAPVHKQQILELGRLTHQLQLQAPVYPGEPVARNAMGLGIDLVATRKVDKEEESAESGNRKRSGSGAA